VQNTKELIIWDLDSTLSHTLHRHDLSPFVNPESDWPTYANACLLDPPIKGAITLLNLLSPFYGIYILSGRDGSAYINTIEWLEIHRVKYDYLRLRQSDDPDGNGEYKSRHIQRLKDEGYTVHLLVDDWPATCDAVEAIGTPTLCVNPRYVDLTMKGFEDYLKKADS
jgi:hypothetical protein